MMIIVKDDIARAYFPKSLWPVIALIIVHQSDPFITEQEKLLHNTRTYMYMPVSQKYVSPGRIRPRQKNNGIIISPPL